MTQAEIKGDREQNRSPEIPKGMRFLRGVISAGRSLALLIRLLPLRMGG